MHFSKHSVIALYAASCASALLIPRQSAFETDFAAIGGALATLGAAIDAFDGSPAGAMAVSSAATDLQTDYETALTDTNAATDLASQSAAIAAAAEALVPPHVDGLSALVAKEPLFAAGGYDPLVLAQLQSLSDACSQLLAALAAKISADISGPTSTIEGSYATAIAAFT